MSSQAAGTTVVCDTQNIDPDCLDNSPNNTNCRSNVSVALWTKYMLVIILNVLNIVTKTLILNLINCMQMEKVIGEYVRVGKHTIGRVYLIEC